MPESEYAQALALIELLAERFPIFQLYERRRAPLKVGIDRDVLAALDGAVSPDELSYALRNYVYNKVYRSRLVAGAQRYDLNGEPAGTVTPEQAQQAAPKPPRLSSPPPSPTPSAAPKRPGLAELRAAAAERREARP
jgi:ProP effector